MASGRVPNTTITFFEFFKFLLPFDFISRREARCSRLEGYVEARGAISRLESYVSRFAPRASCFDNCTKSKPASLAIATAS